MTPGQTGFFISLEGGEGAGKSTQHKRIVGWLEQQGRQVVETREPGGTIVSEQVRQVLLDTRNAGLNPTAELLLLFAARSQLVQEVILLELTLINMWLILPEQLMKGFI